MRPVYFLSEALSSLLLSTSFLLVVSPLTYMPRLVHTNHMERPGFKQRARNFIENEGGMDLLISIAIDYGHKQQFQALELLVAYAFGRPQVEHVEGEDKRPITIVIGQAQQVDVKQLTVSASASPSQPPPEVQFMITQPVADSDVP